MKKIKNFVITSLIGGIIVILPSAILIGVFSWLFAILLKGVRPLAQILIARSGYTEFIAQILVVIILVLFCFFIGLIVKTRLGRYMFAMCEKRLLSIAPGYNLIKETVLQVLGNQKSPFSSVALAQIFGNETLITCFVTDQSDENICTVFVPTGPNPTSGNIYHLQRKYVHFVPVSVEEAMRSIISCGAGSQKLIRLYQKKQNPS